MTDDQQPAPVVESAYIARLAEAFDCEMTRLSVIDVERVIQEHDAAIRAPLEARIAELEQRLERRENAYQVLRVQRDARRDQRDAARAEIEKANGIRDTALAIVRQRRYEIDAAMAEIAKLTTTVTDIRTGRDALAERVRVLTDAARQYVDDHNAALLWTQQRYPNAAEAQRTAIQSFKALEAALAAAAMPAQEAPGDETAAHE